MKVGLCIWGRGIYIYLVKCVVPLFTLCPQAGLVDSMHSFVEDFMDEVDARADIVAQAEAAIEKEAR